MPNANPKVNGQPGRIPPSAPAPATPAQSPSVPISLYRQVATELQSTQSTLQTLKTQNQELTQKNQQLRLEIERVVQSALHLRQIADPSWGAVPSAIPAELLDGDRPDPSGLVVPNPADNLVTEQAIDPVQPTTTEPTAEISTWWLIMIICLIVVTAFGTGFLIVRPLLPSR